MWWMPTGEAVMFTAGLVVGLAIAAAGLWTPPPPPCPRGRHHRKDEP